MSGDILAPVLIMAVANFVALLAWTWSGMGLGMIDRHVLSPDMGLSAVHGTPSVIVMVSLVPFGRPVVVKTFCACSMASPV